ncbi:MAG: hypothetical protein ACYCV4_19680 [Dermatophilaceae bacterium]
MTKKVSAFPLRLRSSELRELARLVAEHDHISQNELIEQALANEVLVRGATIVADLELAAQYLVELTDAQYQQIVAKSLQEFGQGEALPEPLQAYALDPEDVRSYRKRTARRPTADSLGVMAAFNAAS